MKKAGVSLILLVTCLLLYYFYPTSPLPGNTTITKLVVIKRKRVLEIYSHEVLLKTYPIALGKVPEGKKEINGDNKTPEGIYIIQDKNPGSAFHKNLGISYPNQHDLANAEKKNRIAGGEIKIH